MKKFLVIGSCAPFIIEAVDWESAFWKAWESLSYNLVSITVLPLEECET